LELEGDYMQIGDICLDKGTGWISKTIEDFEHSKYSHATTFIGYDNLIEAEGFERTGTVPIEKYQNQLDIYTCDSLTDAQRQEIKEYLIKEVGSRYDYLLLLVEAIRYVFHVVLPYKEPFKSHICSTLVVDAYKSVGIELCPNIKYPSPADLSNSKLLRKIGTY
jgi:uncharacterized protein YycO